MQMLITFTIFVRLISKVLYNLADDSRIPKMGLDLKLDDGKLVSIPYIQTDGQKDKKTDRVTQIHGTCLYQELCKS